MAPYELSEEANRDLEAISAFITEGNPLRAISFVDEMIAKFSKIAERPCSFPRSDDLPAELRSALHGKYRIIFRVAGGIPVILRVVHGARDIESMF